MGNESETEQRGDFTEFRGQARDKEQKKRRDERYVKRGRQNKTDKETEDKEKKSVRALRVRFVLLYGSFHMLLYNKSNGITKTNALCVLENSPFTT